jgi:outer membrane assembly lipoprotein YfiO
MSGKRFFLLLSVFAAASQGLLAQETQSTPQTSNVMTVQEYFSFLQQSVQNKKWSEVIQYCHKIHALFPSSPFTKEALYHEGQAYFYLQEYEKANEIFSRYLQEQPSAKFFEEVITYKFQIAEQFREGVKKHLFGWNAMPKLESAVEDALKLYDEVLAVFPHHELAAKALFAKGSILLETMDFSDSLSAFQQLIRRFPKHELSIEAFLRIGEIYLQQCDPKRQDPNLISLAEVNFTHFKEAFPGETRIEEAQKMIGEMKEIFAKGLFEIGDFFERTHKDQAARIYYAKILANFPDTPSAKSSKERLDNLQKKQKTPS